MPFPSCLIALDLDGTLIGRDLSISPRAKRAIQDLKEVGVQFTIATGRMFRSSRTFAQELHIDIPIICYQGALIGHPVSGEVIWHCPLPLALARQAIAAVKETGLHLNLYLDDELYVENLTEEAQRYVQIARVPIHQVQDFFTLLRKKPTKLVAVGKEDRISEVEKDLKARFGSSLYISQSYPFFLEIAHPASGKGKALAWLCRYLGIPREQTVAMGDGDNDLDMVEWAGLGIAVANASPRVRAAADWITGPQEEEGAAQALEKILKLRKEAS